MQPFEKGLTAYLASGETLSKDAKALKKFLAKNPKGPLRNRVMKQMKLNADAIVENSGDFRSAGYGSFSAVDWEKLIAMLGPLLKLILSLFM